MSEPFKLRIESEADLAGLDAYLAALPKLDASQETVEKGLNDLGAEGKRAGLTFGQLEKELRQAQLAMSMLTPSDARLPDLQRHIAGVSTELMKSRAGMQGFRGDIGQSALMMAQFADDAQYGLRGIMNNVPGLVMALGGGAGLAGVLSIAMLAVSKLWEAFGGADGAMGKTDAAAKKLDDLKSALERAGKAIQGDYSGNKENAQRITEAFTQSLERERQALEAEIGAMEQQLALLQRRQQVQGDADKRMLAAETRDIEESGLRPDAKANAIASRKAAAAEAERARQEQAASEGISTSADAAMRHAQERERAKAAVAALETEKRATAELLANNKEQARLAEEVKSMREAKRAAESTGDFEVIADAVKALRDLEQRFEAARKASREALAALPEGRARGMDQIQSEIDAQKAVATREDAAAKAAAAEAQQKLEREKIDRIGRNNTFNRDIEEIERERRKAGGDLPPPRNPLGLPEPLPDLRSTPGGVPMYPGEPPRSPLDNGPAPLPGRGPAFNRPPPAPLDNSPAPLPGTESIDQAAASNAAANAEVLKFASAVTEGMQRITEDNAALKQQIATLSSQIANSRPA